MLKDLLNHAISEVRVMEPIGLGRFGENLSIMIPNYNGAQYIAETLSSVWRQTGWFENAQIVVVDNCSTDDSESIVRNFGNGKVKFFRNESNLGLIGNWDRCLELAERPWIHVLHNDDLVLPGAYEEFNHCISEYPGTIAVFGRSLMIDEQSVVVSVYPRLGPDMRGQWSYDPLQWSSCPVQCVGAVISQEAVRRVGRFSQTKFQSCVDWDTWWRIVKDGNAAYTNVLVGSYRVHGNNYSRAAHTAGIMLSDSLGLVNHIVDSLKSDPKYAHLDFDRLYQSTFEWGLYVCGGHFHHDEKAFQANVAVLRKYPSNPSRQRALRRLLTEHQRIRLGLRDKVKRLLGRT